MKRLGDLLGHKYRKWEQTGRVFVFATDGVPLDDLEPTIAIINQVIAEFKLPLRTVNGNSNKVDVPLVEELIMNNSESGLIDCNSIMEEFRRHWNERTFPFGLVVLIDDKRFQFKNNCSDHDPAEYGWSHDEGLSLVRRFDIPNAVRHEFGHMVGLGVHHPHCAMDWHCTVHDFCSNCKATMNEIWK